MPDASTYANLMVNEEYLPLAQPATHPVHSIRLPRNLIFRDELAGAWQLQLATDELATLFIEPIVLSNGPR